MILIQSHIFPPFAILPMLHYDFYILLLTQVVLYIFLHPTLWIPHIYLLLLVPNFFLLYQEISYELFHH